MLCKASDAKLALIPLCGCLAALLLPAPSRHVALYSCQHVELDPASRPRCYYEASAEHHVLIRALIDHLDAWLPITSIYCRTLT